VLDEMWNRKNIDSHWFQRTPGGRLAGIEVDLGEGDPGVMEVRVKKLLKAITWTLRRLYGDLASLGHRHTAPPPQNKPPWGGITQGHNLEVED
jgi:hypothetical protein